MERRRRAGQPGSAGSRRPAGAPPAPAGPAGAPGRGRPGSNPAEPDAGASERPAANPAEADARASERQGQSGERERAGAEHSAGTDSGAEEAARVDADLDELLAETKRERDEYLELARRTKADFENYRRRAVRDAEEAERRGKSTLARELVPVLDNLERALRASGIEPEATQEEAGGGDGASLAHGVRLTYTGLRATLERAGVEAYDPRGERFDPAWHEALATRTEQGTEPGVVLETVEKGYRLDGQVLRPARVVVSA